MSDLVITNFKKRIKRHLDIELDLFINENRTIMLNLLERKRNSARLSVHRMFLDAPENVIEAIADYVRGKRANQRFRNLVLRSYIQSNLSRFDQSDLVDEKKLSHAGRTYNLKLLYQKINRKYFQNSLNLKITWYGDWGKKNRSRINFGLYYDALKLIKIHRILDDSFFPEYFVSFVIYHEMLHYVVPGRVDAKGYFRSHTLDFKKKEQEFEFYREAILWERQNRNFFFKG